MPRYIAFLRAINVGGHVVKMDVLRAEFEKLGFRGVETFIASGNVIFETRSTKTAAIEDKIEKALHQALGYEVATFVRTPAQIAAIAKHQAFAPEAVATCGALNVGMLKTPLEPARVQGLAALRTDIDDFHANGAELYWICAMKQNESKVSNAAFERLLKGKATFRGMKTIEKLVAKYPR
jgi:uncharacterized protein (DUF1697 family)